MPKLIFIGTSGRSGSYGLTQALNLIPGVEAHHQYACVEVQRIGTLVYRGKIFPYQAKLALDLIYGAVLDHCKAEFFVDVSNKLPWVMELLVEMYQPTTAYVVRNGKKVCLSYYHKLPETYSIQNVIPLVKHLTGESFYPPPHEEKYWWPYPNKFATRWELLCWHWWQSYELAQGDKFRFEDLLVGQFQDFLATLGIQRSVEAEEFLLSKPHNVIEPHNYEMSELQERAFESICGELYRSLGYEEAYDVEYLQPV